jgi:N-acetylmuramic acid 6-phosphate etherase
MKIPAEKLASLLTEQINPRTTDIDILSSREIVRLMHHEDYQAFTAIDSQLEVIGDAVELIVSAFQNRGRLIYIGAGTSGRLGVLDAAECPPTFSSEPEMVQGIIAGGWAALRHSIEGAEDDPDTGAGQIAGKDVNANDVVVGIAASSTTPFVVGGLREAHRRHAKTIFITCNPTHVLPEADLHISLLVGPEVLTGSTRLKAGTATKLVLNMLTTASMIRVGKAYRNQMIDLTATCNKLVERSRRIITTLTGLNVEEADALIEKAQGKLKRALVMHFCQISSPEADELIRKNNGRIQDIIPREGL